MPDHSSLHRTACAYGADSTRAHAYLPLQGFDGLGILPDGSLITIQGQRDALRGTASAHRLQQWDGLPCVVFNIAVSNVQN